MQASETKLQKVIEGQLQYVIPLFQRAYSWDKKEWRVLWEDIVELCEAENPRTHFIGSIVSMPTVSVPEGVAKYLRKKMRNKDFFPLRPEANPTIYAYELPDVASQN